MITKEQAINEREFHYHECKKHIGPRGGETIIQHIYRRNGETQTWKTRPDEFRIPVKYGMYGYDQIYHFDAEAFHVPSECPLNKAAEHAV